uniref:VPS37 C-terminal domain-containing protein n=1 Tax=Zooxanthella nutricula TaxID=1333877 RepID=A0A6U6RHA3_9DINO
MFFWRSREPEETPAPRPAPTAVPVVQATPLQQAPAPTRTPGTPRERPPAVPDTFPDLNSLGESELQHMHQSELLLSDFVLARPPVAAIATRVKDLREENNKLAKDLLAKETAFQGASTRVAAGRVALEAKRSSVEALAARKEVLLAKHTPQVMGTGLAQRAQEADQQAEDTLNGALASGDTMDAASLSNFRQKFTQQKMDKHWRLALKESLSK